MLTFKKFKVDRGYVISFDDEEKREIDGKTIFIVPAFKFFAREKAME